MGFNQDFLEHFGVKGMRWGVRRANRRAARVVKDEVRAKKIRTDNAAERKESAAYIRSLKLGKAKTEKAIADDKKYYEKYENYSAKDVAKSRAKGQKIVLGLLAAWGAKQVFDIVTLKKLGLI